MAESVQFRLTGVLNWQIVSKNVQNYSPINSKNSNLEAVFVFVPFRSVSSELIRFVDSVLFENASLVSLLVQYVQ